MDFLSFIPDPIKKQVIDVLVKFLADQAEKTLGEQLANRLRKLSSEAGFLDAFDKAMNAAQKRFAAEYMAVDEDLVGTIAADPKFWQNKSVRKALINMVSHPGAWLYDDQTLLATHFEDVLPHRVNRERVDRAITFFLRCVVEELWTLPGAKEIREVYSLQAQKLTAEAVMQQVALTRRALEIETQLSVDMRHTLQQLTTALEQRILEAPTPPPSLPRPRPYHNLPQPDYTHFVGREREIAWLEQRLSSQDRVWLTVISGIGGVGKSALALAVAHAYRERYHTLPPEERFEAIIWVSAKSEVLTAVGTEQSAPEGLIVRTLEDIYTTISQTLEREDITRALPDDQDRLVQLALGQQRTLLIVDNLESVTDERVKGFLRNLTPPTKALITSREWIDVAAAFTLTGLPQDEAFALIVAEADTRGIPLLLEQQQQQLFERTFGLPLPIKLAVARLASGETFEQVLRWLGDATGSLPEYCVKGHIEFVRHKFMAAWKLLLACSLFDQNIGATRETLGKIVDLSLVDRDDGLTALLRLSLINRTLADRFWLLPMVQGYAAIQLNHMDSNMFVQPWLDWALEYANEHGGNLDLHVERIQELGCEYANIRAAIHWCLKYELWQYVQQLYEQAWFYSYLVGPLNECKTMLEMGLQAAVNLGNRKAQGWASQRLGRLAWAQGKIDAALSHLHQAEVIANELGDDANLGRVYTIRSGILFHQGDFTESRRLAEAGMVIADKIDDPELKGHVVHRLAEIESAFGNYDKSLKLLELDAEWCQKTGWLRQLAWNMRYRARDLFRQGRLAESETLFLKSIEITASWGEPKIVAHAKHGLAEIYYATGRKSLALQSAEEAADLFERLGMEKGLAETQELMQHLS